MTIVLRALLVALAALPAALTAAPKLPDLSGLKGCWGYAAGDQVYREVWLAASDNLMLGSSDRQQAGRSQTFEFLRIVADDHGTRLLLQPEGQTATAYRLASARSGWQFQRESAGQPQTIHYQRLDAQRLQVRLDSTDFILTQKDCDS